MKMPPLAPKAFFGVDMAACEIHRLEGGACGVYSSRRPNKETPNEDAAAVIPAGNGAAVLVVADGMGGGPAGERASIAAVEAITGELEGYRGGEEELLRTAILDGMERANRAVRELAPGAATTLAVVQVEGRIIRPYHVGDSLILVTGGRGSIKLQTIPHSPVGYGVEAGLLDEEAAIRHEDRHFVSNMVGTPEMRIEIGAPLELARRDTLLLASDGLSDNLLIHEIVERIRKGRK